MSPISLDFEYRRPLVPFLFNAFRNRLRTLGIRLVIARKGFHDSKLWVLPGDSIGDQIIQDGHYELHTLKALEYLIDRLKLHTGCLIDVGANIGNHTVYLAQRISRVVAVEPNPLFFSVLSVNVLFNKLLNVRLLNHGLGDREQDLPYMENSSGNLGGSGFTIAGHNPDRSTHTLRVKRGDEIFRGEVVSLIKIDTEGFEVQCLRGLAETIRIHRPVVAFELTRWPGGSITAIANNVFSDYDFYVFEPSCAGSHRVLRALYWALFGLIYRFKRINILGAGNYEMVFAIPRIDTSCESLS